MWAVAGRRQSTVSMRGQSFNRGHVFKTSLSRGEGVY